MGWWFLDEVGVGGVVVECWWDGDVGGVVWEVVGGCDGDGGIGSESLLEVVVEVGAEGVVVGSGWWFEGDGEFDVGEGVLCDLDALDGGGGVVLEGGADGGVEDGDAGAVSVNEGYGVGVSSVDAGEC